MRDARAEPGPFAFVACGTGQTGRKGGTQGMQALAVKVEDRTGLQRDAKPIGSCGQGPLVAVANATVAAMGFGAIQHRCADLVRPFDDFDILACRKALGNPAEVLREGGRVALADEGEQTQEMMSPKTNHQNMATPFSNLPQEFTSIRP